MKKLPVGIQTFQKIREDDYIYVDKTDIAIDLIDRYQFTKRAVYRVGSGKRI